MVWLGVPLGRKNALLSIISQPIIGRICSFIAYLVTKCSFLSIYRKSFNKTRAQGPYKGAVFYRVCVTICL